MEQITDIPQTGFQIFLSGTYGEGDHILPMVGNNAEMPGYSLISLHQFSMEAITDLILYARKAGMKTLHPAIRTIDKALCHLSLRCIDREASLHNLTGLNGQTNPAYREIQRAFFVCNFPLNYLIQ